MISKKNFIKKVSKIIKIKEDKLIDIDDMSNIEDFDSLNQLALVMIYDEINADEKTIKKLSSETKLSKILTILEKNKLVK